ncbi:2,3-bisphosphoglycerate-independent phosphoglycerate mutase [Actinomadura macra]|uniref:2,3-bisphosphoglycerate-independent phosphoglycerate mutase n=1 Tax=Actinomadura macra TaxID=46164 RepID=UPI00082DD182|nr:2,3-bisphosphoglycerate-independent phosphoglycerate mutase [Actinomadura macra]
MAGSAGRGGVLLILDGWGRTAPGPGNAIAAARTPVLDELEETHPGLLLDASGTAVGLPEGVVGNSEIGHLVIGAGRPVTYDSLLVEERVRNGTLREDPLLRQVCAELAGRGGTLHLVGLCSDGRIHSDIAHLGELLRAAAGAGRPEVRLHAITDGRDVADGSAAGHLERLGTLADEAGTGAYATVIGRNYAMDKSGDIALTDRAVRLILDGEAERTVPHVRRAVPDESDSGDGWIRATAIGTWGRPGTGTVVDGDVILFANFRSDRTAPLVDAIADRLAGSGRERVRLLSLAQYDTRTDVRPLVPRADAGGGLADALEAAGARSVRIAEREKFEHVTFFINGRDARPRKGEERIQVPSGTDDYRSRPSMNLPLVVAEVIAAASRDDVDLVIANLANIDVVGHTGDHAATVRATEAVDGAVGEIRAAARTAGRWVLLVGDHGNGEQMLQAAAAEGISAAYGGHTTNPVPCLLMPAGTAVLTAPSGPRRPALPSVGTTVLRLLDLPHPATMTAPPLIG